MRARRTQIHRLVIRERTRSASQDGRESGPGIPDFPMPQPMRRPPVRRSGDGISTRSWGFFFPPPSFGIAEKYAAGRHGGRSRARFTVHAGATKPGGRAFSNLLNGGRVIVFEKFYENYGRCI